VLPAGTLVELLAQGAEGDVNKIGKSHRLLVHWNGQRELPDGIWTVAKRQGDLVTILAPCAAGAFQHQTFIRLGSRTCPDFRVTQ